MRDQAVKASLYASVISLALVATSASAQRLGQADDTDVSIARVLAALLLIIVLAGAAMFVGRARIAELKFWRPASARRLQVVETARLSPQAMLCLAACDGKEYLIAITPGAASVLNTSDIKAEAHAVS